MSLLKAQDLKKRIEGEWVCKTIVDEQGNKSEGKFGSSNEYLRFTFFGKKLTISEAPFDEKLAKNWHPVVINNSATESKMEFSLSLISSDKPFVMPFKNAN
jgi:hypothetical protein